MRENGVTLYPESTTNANVPADAFLLAEEVAVSGEVVVTWYINPDGTMRKVLDWSTSWAEAVSMCEVCRITWDTEMQVRLAWECHLYHQQAATT